MTTIDENTSDGYHTFKELYEFRLLYNAALFNEFTKQGLYNVQKSIRHCDGELCFGGGWFVVICKLPTGQITNHYELEHWNKFKCPDFEKPTIEFDGHNANDVATRLAEFLK